MSQQPPSSSVQDKQVEQIRRTANIRSISRTDPAIVDILESTDHATVFLNDDNGAWKKTKMEGPTFIVQRSKKPYYAVFMLNRMALNNVLIPLTPGEIKTVLLDDELLQIRKRGEEGRSLWIPVEHDATGIARFHKAILQICGEPVKKLEGAGSNTSSPVNVPAGLRDAASPATAPAATSDPFARLLRAAHPSSPSSVAPSPQPTSQLAANPNSRSPANPMTTLHGASTAPAQEGRMTPPVQAGQTADRLVQSLLDTSPSVPLPNSQPANAPTSTSNAPQPKYSPPALRTRLPSTQAPTPTNTTGQAPRRGRVGDSTFAQATQQATPDKNRAPKLSPDDRRQIVQAIAATLAYRHEVPPSKDRHHHLHEFQHSVRTTLMDPAFADEVWATYLAAIDTL